MDILSLFWKLYDNYFMLLLVILSRLVNKRVFCVSVELFIKHRKLNMKLTIPAYDLTTRKWQNILVHAAQ